MSPPPVERRLRLVCRALAVTASLGAIVELWLVDHTGSKLQLLPFGLCAVIVGSVLLVSLGQAHRFLRVHRILMLLVLFGSAYGVYAHVSHNMTFAREIRPSAPSREIWIAGVRGANPLLAAGVLAMAAGLGLAGAYGVATSERSNGSEGSSPNSDV